MEIVNFVVDVDHGFVYLTEVCTMSRMKKNTDSDNFEKSNLQDILFLVTLHME